MDKPTVQQIAELCYSKFRDLPKTGKPTNSQWTVLAGIVQYDRGTQTSKVVALATGFVQFKQKHLNKQLTNCKYSAPDALVRVSYVPKAL